MKLSPLLLCLITPVMSMACLNNEAVTLKDGYDLYQDEDDGFVPSGHIFMINPEGEYSIDARLRRLDSLWKQTHDLAYLSDYGLVLIVGGRYDEAIKLYLEIERTHPGRYSTASNIGTAYELKGNNEEAIRWIRRAIEINPSSHFSSEWLHVKILEAKTKGEQFYTSDFLIGSGFGSGVEPVTNRSRRELLQLRDALFYQLNERMSFVKRNDRMVAVLLFDLANVCWLTGERWDAIRIYETAKIYGMSGDVLETRYNNLSKRAREAYSKSLTDSATHVTHAAISKQDSQDTLVYVMSVVAVVGIGVVILKRARKVKS